MTPAVAPAEVATEALSAEAIEPADDRTSPSPKPAAKSLESFIGKTSEVLEKMRRIEGRVAADQDLKLSDPLR